MAQHEILKETELLRSNGKLTEEGWARHHFWNYNRKAVKGSVLSVKEWDYYAINSVSGEWFITATISDLGYAGLFNIAFIDLIRGKAVQCDSLQPFPLGKTIPQLPDNYLTQYNDHKLRITFTQKGSERHLIFGCPSLVLPDGSVGLDVDVTLYQTPGDESMNIATSWEKHRTCFYLNEKINCMPVSGRVRLGKNETELESGDCWGVLDWGRGKWTYQNRWYWSSASGLVDGRRFGWNFGYGFTDRTPASENVLFCDGKINKLEDVSFEINTSDYKANWKITSPDDRVNLVFYPATDRSSKIDMLLIKTIQHQVFGYFSGNVTLDDGTVLDIQRFPGFAEDVFNRY